MQSKLKGAGQAHLQNTDLCFEEFAGIFQLTCGDNLIQRISQHIAIVA